MEQIHEFYFSTTKDILFLNFQLSILVLLAKSKQPRDTKGGSLGLVGQILGLLDLLGAPLVREHGVHLDALLGGRVEHGRHQLLHLRTRLLLHLILRP